MSYLALLCLLVHQSHGYSIKMQGKVEVGQDLAVIFQDLFDQYLQNSNGQTEIDMSKLVQAVNDFVVPEPPPQTYGYDKGKKQIRREDGKVQKDKKKERHETKARGEKNKAQDVEKEEAQEDIKVKNEKPQREKTFLEEIAGKQEKVHVYGKHTEDKKDLPFNNINV